MLSNGEKLVVLAVLHLQRKSESEANLARDERDLEDVFEALKSCGYQVLPKGVVEGLKKTLARLR